MYLFTSLHERYLQPLSLSLDAHKLTRADEVARVHALGGMVEQGRVRGKIDVTRALGAARFKVTFY